MISIAAVELLYIFIVPLSILVYKKFDPMRIPGCCVVIFKITFVIYLLEFIFVVIVMIFSLTNRGIVSCPVGVEIFSIFSIIMFSARPFLLGIIVRGIRWLWF